MALLQNGFRDYSSGVRIFGATAINSTYPYILVGNADKTSLKRNNIAGEGFTNELVSVPSGYRDRYTWNMAQKNGAMKSFRESEGVATVTSPIEGGKNGVGTSAGVATTGATLQLVVSGIGTSNGVATVSGNVYAALGAAGSTTAAATATATIGALAWGVGASSGVATTSLVRYATGKLTGSIAPAVQLEASSFSSYLLDEEDVETGMTLRQALRLVAAASAGKISGASGTTVVIRNAVADSKDRVTATVDSNGNRTAITYDLD